VNSEKKDIFLGLAEDLLFIPMKECLSWLVMLPFNQPSKQHTKKIQMIFQDLSGTIIYKKKYTTLNLYD
jgi:hypothetical protein